MIIFVDLGNQIDMRERFTFFDTVVDEFVEYDGESTWTCWEGFEAAVREELQSDDLELVEALLNRCRRLVPDKWKAKKSVALSRVVVELRIEDGDIEKMDIEINERGEVNSILHTTPPCSVVPTMEILEKIMGGFVAYLPEVKGRVEKILKGERVLSANEEIRKFAEEIRLWARTQSKKCDDDANEASYKDAHAYHNGIWSGMRLIEDKLKEMGL